MWALYAGAHKEVERYHMSGDRLTKRQAVVISVYTGTTACDFEFIHEYIEELMGRPVFTHELAGDEINEELKKRSRGEFLSICYDKNDPDCDHSQRNWLGICADCGYMSE